MASANEKSTSPALDAAANSSPNGDIEVDNAVDAAAMNEKKASIDDAPTDSKAQPAAAAPVAAPAAAGEAAPDPFAHLPEDQATTLRRQVETPEQKYGVFHLYSYATKMDLLIILCATICSCASGAAMPAMTIIFGGLQGTFQDYISLGIISYAEFQHEIAQFVLYFVYLAVGTFFATYVSTVGFIYTGEHITTNIRQRYLESCLRQNIGFYDKLGAGEVAVKITSDANAIQDGISEKVGLLLGSVATLITGFLIGFVISWKLTLIMSATFVAMFINTALWTSCIIKSALPMTIIIAKASGLAQEMISFVRTAVAFGAQPRLATQYDKQLGASKGYGVQVKAWIAMMLAVVMGMMYLNYGLGFWQGSFFLARGELDIEDMLTTLMAVMIGSFNVGAVAPHYQAFLEAVNTASRLFVVINRDTPIDGTRDDGEKPATVEGRIQLEAVKHIYPSRPEVTVVDGVSLDFPAGKVTALVGASGSGKSTIVGLIERFYSPVAGKVLLDGRDITSLNLRWLRQKIGFVAQEPVLFSGSVYENIRYGLIGSQHEHADEQVQREMIVAAAKNANAHEFISQLTEGYDTKVGQRGFLLSGGQKQRIAIARATVSDPRILLLDEATSALDTKSEGVVQAALEQASKGRTTITIAHRLSTVRDADNIVVMASGKVVEQGTHEQLIEMQGAYFDLVHAQQFAVEKKTAESSDEDEDEEDHKDQLLRRLSQIKNVGSLPYDTEGVASSSARSSLSQRQTPHRTSTTRDSTLVAANAQAIAQESVAYSSGSLIAFVYSFNKPEWFWLLIALFFSVVAGLTNPVQSVFFAKQMLTLANIGREGFDKWEVQRDSNFWSLMFLMLGLVNFLAYAVQGVAFGYCAEALIRRVKDLCMRHILRQDISFFDHEKNSSGALTAFLATESAQLTNICGGTIGNMLVSITSIVAGIALALAIGWKLALVCLSVVPLLIATGFFRFYILAKYTNRAARVYSDSAAYAVEHISSIRTVALLTLEDQVAGEYRSALAKQQKQSLISVSKSGLLYAFSQGVMFLCLGLGFWYGSTLMATFEYTIFQFFVCLMSVIFGTQATGSLLTNIPDIVKAKVSAANIKTLFDRKPAIDAWNPSGKIIEKVQGRIEFQNVHFRYPTRPEKPVLRGLDLKVEPGQNVAIVGASGCGKSTTISLLERFYDPLLGKVLLDGVDISEIQVNDYRSHIALVSQEPALFQGSIKQNICMGSLDENISDEAIEAACRSANIYDFIVSLPEGFNTDVGIAGALLSGGQKQRIAIARAMLRSPKVLLLDEATSALDSESEKVVQAALDSVAKGRTTITIAHRLTTIQRADVIYVLDQGRVAEAGTHQELMELNGRYAELVKLQSLD